MKIKSLMKHDFHGISKSGQSVKCAAGESVELDDALADEMVKAHPGSFEKAKFEKPEDPSRDPAKHADKK